MNATFSIYYHASNPCIDRLKVEVTSLARYRHLAVKKINLSDIAVKPKEKALTPRQRAIAERDDEIRAAFDEAATLPSSEAVAIELKEGQKLPTLRAAIQRIHDAERRGVNFAVRGTTIFLSKGDIPGRRGRRRAKA